MISESFGYGAKNRVGIGQADATDQMSIAGHSSFLQEWIQL